MSFLEVWKAEVWCNLTEFIVFFKQFVDLVLVGMLVNLVSGIELLNIVDQTK